MRHFTDNKRSSLAWNRPTAWFQTLLISLTLIGASSCNNVSPVAGDPQPGVALSGKVHGGQQPVVGATIHLYSAGRSGSADGSAATSLLTAAVVSDVNGDFSITTHYTCNPTDEIYITATGGNPGLGVGASNPNLAMMAALGLCSGLSSATFASINEVTTATSISALKQFMLSPTALGSGPHDDQQLIDAFSLVNQLADIATGLSPGPTLPGGSSVPTTAIYTLSDIVADCINSSGGVAGDNSNCGNLFLFATPAVGSAPTDTIAALLDIFNNPTHNVTSIFNLSGTNGPFQPVLSSAPASWAIKVTPAVTVTLSPKTPSVDPGLTQQFSAITTNAPDPSIQWQVNGVVGGNSTLGTISTSGLYTSPSTVSGPTNLTITAVSNWDPTVVDTATLTLNPNVTITVAPSPVSVHTSATQQFTATVTSATGTPAQNVVWSLTAASCPSACGTISSSGLYTAPANVPANANVIVIATWALDNRQAGAAAITLQ